MDGTNSNPNLPAKRSPKRFASTTHVNEVVDYLRTVGAPHALGERRPAGRWTFSFLGKIVSAGPASEADYTDERYWIEPQKAATTGDVRSTIHATADHSLFTDKIVTATNLIELLIGKKHRTPAGTLVRVFAEADDSGAVQFAFSEDPPPVDELVRVTVAGGSGGNSNTVSSWTYNLYPYDPPGTSGAAIVAGTYLPDMQKAKMEMLAGKIGMIHRYGGTNGVSLAWVDEVPHTNVDCI